MIAALIVTVTGCRSGEAVAPFVAPTGAAAAVVAPSAAAPALWFGGDVHLGVAARGGMEGIAAIVGGAAGIVNLEGPVADGPGGARIDGTRVWLANPAEAPRWLRAQGIAGVSVANNHAEDAGLDGAARTIRALRGAGVAPAGGAAGVARLDVGGIIVSLLAHDLREPDLGEVLATELAAGEGTVRAVTLHVTGAGSYLPSPALRAAVDRAVAGGADIVVAHGTHTIGPVERRGETLVAWGLGNLLFDCACTAESEALVLRVAVGADGVGAAEVIPVTAGLGGAGVTPAEDAEGVFDLLDAIGSSALTRRGDRAGF